MQSELYKFRQYINFIKIPMNDDITKRHEQHNTAIYVVIDGYVDVFYLDHSTGFYHDLIQDTADYLAKIFGCDNCNVEYIQSLIMEYIHRCDKNKKDTQA